MTTVPALVDEIPLDQYVSTAGQTDFNFTYMIFATTDIKVYVNGVLKTITTDYTVKTAAGGTVNSSDLPMDGGKVVFITPLALNDAVSLSRDIPISRLTGYSVAGAFRADVVNAEFTKIYAVMQQLERDLFRGITLAPYDTAGDNLVLPAVRANSFLAFDTDGNIITAASAVTGALVSEFMETVLDDQSALEARVSLGLTIGTNVQAWDAQLDILATLATANLSTLAGLTGAANKVARFTGAGAMELVDLVSSTESVAGIAKIASDPEAAAATSDTTIITPLKQRIVQVVNTQTGAVATGTGIIPLDDTIPQNTEGDQYMSLSITPTNASNKLRIDVVCEIGNSTSGLDTCIALFQDSNVNALAAIAEDCSQANNLNPLHLTHFMTAGTTLSTTFKVRAGRSGASTTTFNGNAGTRIFGGVCSSSITITEIKA